MPRKLLAAALLLFASTALAQSSQPATQPAPKHTAPKPAEQQAAGAAPHKVWVNLRTGVYHCPGARYYGKTAEGKYMTEPEARKAGAHGARNQTCFAK